MATNELIEKLKEIIVHVGLAGEYKPGYDIVKNLRKTKCKECIRLADELEVLESEAKEPSDEDIEHIKQECILVETNLRIATSKIRTDPFFAEMYLQNSLQAITNINSYIESQKNKESIKTQTK